jgi:type VI secretion system secreted protein Hcp
VTAVSHKITTRVDPVTGAASGKRKHEPIAATIVIDQATPKLNQAAVTNETLRPDSGVPQPTAATQRCSISRLALTNALIIDVALSTHESRDPTLTKGFEYEEIKLTYRKIEWTWNNGGIAATDCWAACI